MTVFVESFFIFLIAIVGENAVVWRIKKYKIIFIAHVEYFAIICIEYLSTLQELAM